MEGGERFNRGVAMAVVVEREEREKEREIIQLHRLCSRSQTIYVGKEQKRKKKQGDGRLSTRRLQRGILGCEGEVWEALSK